MQSSSFKIPFLPAELVREILLRLPVKSLLQFRCVSKSWLCLISTPDFIKTHLTISANNKDSTHHRLMLRFLRPCYDRLEHSTHHRLTQSFPRCWLDLKECSISSLLYDSVAKAFDLDYPMKNPDNHVWVLGSVNGLICFSDGLNIILWNPSIRKFMTFYDELSNDCLLYGFGYDELSDDYKLVGLRRERYRDYVDVKMYSLNSYSWSVIDKGLYEGLFIDEGLYEWLFIDEGLLKGPFAKREGVFVNGKLHWVYSHELLYNNGWGIISVDLVDGKWEKVEPPCYGEGDFDLTPCVGVSGSNLSVLCNRRNTLTDVWIMKEYGVKESWTKMHTINHPHNASKLFCISNNGEILFEFKSAFMMYNPKDDSIRHKQISHCYGCYGANIYIESLVWPICHKEPRIQQRMVQRQRRKKPKTQQLRKLKKNPRVQQRMQLLRKLKKLNHELDTSKINEQRVDKSREDLVVVDRH